jgi:hypothetical protein
MGSFLKENWIWIVAPLALILLGVAALIVFSNNGGGGDGGFQYDLF